MGAKLKLTAFSGRIALPAALSILSHLIRTGHRTITRNTSLMSHENSGIL